MSHVATYFEEAARICERIDRDAIERLATSLAGLRARGGRLFVLGVGGSAANAAHAVNDFRKLCGIEAYAPTDSVAELTARTNDEGWDRISAADALLVLSVGGGDPVHGVSVNLVRAIDAAKAAGAAVYGVVGRAQGDTARRGDIVVTVPTVSDARVTPHAEAFQAVVWHCLVSHPVLQTLATKW